MSTHILIVDDDALMRRSLAATVARSGYRVSTAATAEEALALIVRHPPTLVLLDVGLPGMDGLAALREIQKQGDIAVIFVTARRRELEQVLGLELGADDYITKPFDPDVLMAHVKAVLRRTGVAQTTTITTSSALQVGDLYIDSAAHTITCRGEQIDLSPREFDLLHALALAADRVVTADDLLAQVWGAEYAGESQSVYVHIRRLREKLEAEPSRPQRIITVRGVGYKLVSQGE